MIVNLEDFRKHICGAAKDSGVPDEDVERLRALGPGNYDLVGYRPQTFNSKGCPLYAAIPEVRKIIDDQTRRPSRHLPSEYALAATAIDRVALWADAGVLIVVDQ